MTDRFQVHVAIASWNNDALCILQTGVAADDGQTQPMGRLVGKYKSAVGLACRNLLAEYLLQLVADNDFLLLHF
jgi:hypothetical protein